MTYSVYQHWDPLKVMVVGKSYPPELYDYIKNEKVRKVFYQIAEETEEDYQKLSNLLSTFGVNVIRCDMDEQTAFAKQCIKKNAPISKPWAMQPRDATIMLGETFYCSDHMVQPLHEALDLLKLNGNKIDTMVPDSGFKYNNNPIYMNAAMTTRVGKDLIIGTLDQVDKDTNIGLLEKNLQDRFTEYRVKMIATHGHTDGCFCPVVPGLIFSIMGPWNYKSTFPDWEVLYLHGESWSKVQNFLNLKKNNAGKWWVPGQELNQDFTDYVETWMNHWVGYVEESVFDVNMIVVDKKNVIVNSYNEKAFDAFSRHGITPHICNFRHRYFWDGGLHCITSDIHREGVMEDYFPERNQ
jgi:N-dimethylarginine dimethylaminohydrolase